MIVYYAKNILVNQVLMFEAGDLHKKNYFFYEFLLLARQLSQLSD